MSNPKPPVKDLFSVLPYEVVTMQADLMLKMGTTYDWPLWVDTLLVEETNELLEAVAEIDSEKPITEQKEQYCNLLKELADVVTIYMGQTLISPTILQDHELSKAIMGEEVLKQRAQIMSTANNTVITVCDFYRISFNILIEAYSLVTASNLTKLGEDGLPVYREDGKVKKGPNYQAPDMTPAYDALVHTYQSLKQKG